MFGPGLRLNDAAFGVIGRGPCDAGLGVGGDRAGGVVAEAAQRRRALRDRGQAIGRGRRGEGLGRPARDLVSPVADRVIGPAHRPVFAGRRGQPPRRVVVERLAAGGVERVGDRVERIARPGQAAVENAGSGGRRHFHRRDPLVLVDVEAGGQAIGEGEALAHVSTILF